MILAMLYCLTHKIEFVLYSKHANFGYRNGWTDYFLPFCDEVDNDFHKQYNHRYPGAYFNRLERLKLRYYKLFYRFDYFTHELWYAIRDQDVMESRHYYIPELGIDGDLNSACRVLEKMTWHYNQETQTIIEKQIKNIALPENYVGIHVRRGDKSSEADFINLYNYIKLIEMRTEIRNVFVATDDYSIYEFLNGKCKDCHFYTITSPDDKGFFYNQYSQNLPDKKREQLLVLLTTIEILAVSDLFIGTFSSNIGMYLGMRMPKEKCIGVDFDKWVMW